MAKMESWGGREGVFVIERSPQDREGTIWVGDRGTRCVCDRKMPREKSRYTMHMFVMETKNQLVIYILGDCVCLQLSVRPSYLAR